MSGALAGSVSLVASLHNGFLHATVRSGMSAAARGTLLGLACGDALGRPVASMTGASIAAAYGRLTEMRGNGTHGLPAGTVTDGTGSALCVARSLAEHGGFDGADVATRYVAYYESAPFDGPGLTRAALARIVDGTPWDEAGAAVLAERPGGRTPGNGSLVRCVPYALAYREEAGALADAVAADARITHADERCVESCVALARVLAVLLGGGDPERALGDAMDLARRRSAPAEVRTTLSAATDPALAALESDGHVVHALETALHDALTAPDAEEAVVTAVNRGVDADTTGAVAGAVAGARFGADALPARWLDALDEVADLRALADDIDAVAVA
jgi:ADP-ribosyl-[dinitrogen reductase] hydrolase